MKPLVLLVAVLLLLAGAVYAKAYELTKKAGDYNVVVRFDKNAPAAGNNKLDISIKDASRKAVTDAMIVVHYSMPAMPGMPAINYKTDAVLKGSGYQANINLSMAGSWTLDIRATRGQAIISAKFNVDAT